MTIRPICPACNQRPVAVNLRRKGVTYYRSRCDTCIRSQRQPRPAVPRWQSTGYKKKPTCDLCGFRARYRAQLMVYHVDGRLTNCELRNLKTVCLNCVVVVQRADYQWQCGDLEPDNYML